MRLKAGLGILLVGAIFGGAACQGSDSILAPGGSGQRIAVVSGDYTDTVVSLFDRLTREVVAPELVGSFGSPPALSGDVVPAQTPAVTGDLVLLDRGNANVTIVRPADGVILRQWSARTDALNTSNPNPMDAFYYSAQKLYVTRQGRCARPVPDPFGFCETIAAPPEAFDLENSNDLVVMDPATGQISDIPGLDFTAAFGAGGTGQIDSAAGDVARPARILWTGTYLAVLLLNLNIEIDGTGGSGLIALVDPASDTVVDATPVSTPGSADAILLEDGAGVCRAPGGDGRAASYDASDDTVFVACSGIFAFSEGDYAAQLAASRVFRVDLSPLSQLPPADAIVTEVLNVDDLYPLLPSTSQAPLTGQIQVVSPTLGFVVAYGAFGCAPFCTDSTAPTADVSSALFAFDPSAAHSVNATPLLLSDPFALGGMLADGVTKTLYQCDNAFSGSNVRVFDYLPGADGAVSGAALEDAAAAFLPNNRPGQAPRELAYY